MSANAAAPRHVLQRRRGLARLLSEEFLDRVDAREGGVEPAIAPGLVRAEQHEIALGFVDRQVLADPPRR